MKMKIFDITLIFLLNSIFVNNLKLNDDDFYNLTEFVCNYYNEGLKDSCK